MSYQPGQVLLGNYRIEELIGVGSFGEVYRVVRQPLAGEYQHNKFNHKPGSKIHG